MTPEHQYQKAIDLATDAAKLINGNRSKIPYSMWICFQPLYSEMLKRKEIEPLKNLPEEIKRKYWNEVKAGDGSKFKKIWIAESLYLYDLITHENDNETIRVREAD